MKVRIGDGPLSLEEAKMIFHKYYNDSTKSDLGRLRAKMFDIMYHRPPKYVLEPNSPESIKYALPKGPKTFDMKGVDWFPVGTEVCIEDPAYNKKLGNEKCIIVKGAKRLKDGTTFKEHFSKKYQERRKKAGDLENQNLVDIYHDKRRKGVETKRRPKVLKPYKKIEGFQDEVNRFRYFDCDTNSDPILCIQKKVPDFSKTAYKIDIDKQAYYIDINDVVYNSEFSKIGYIYEVSNSLKKKLIANGVITEDYKLTPQILGQEKKTLADYYGEFGLDNLKKLGQI